MHEKWLIIIKTIQVLLAFGGIEFYNVMERKSLLTD